MGGLQGRRVVDAVAGDRDNVALILERLDNSQLLIRTDPRENEFRCIEREPQFTLGKPVELSASDDPCRR
jgi:hypothetical protein